MMYPSGLIMVVESFLPFFCMDFSLLLLDERDIDSARRTRDVGDTF